jgi:hypothetical protein
MFINPEGVREMLGMEDTSRFIRKNESFDEKKTSLLDGKKVTIIKNEKVAEQIKIIKDRMTQLKQEKEVDISNG